MQTLIIKNENGPVLINSDEYREEEHGPTYETVEAAGGEAAGEPRNDGPTVAEYIERGYRAVDYPPQGYASRSTPEEIAEAIAKQANGGGTSVTEPGTPTGVNNDGHPTNIGEATPPATPATLAVTKKGKKFIVVDTAGNVIERDGIEKDGYASDADAWAAIMALSAPQA